MSPFFKTPAKEPSVAEQASAAEQARAAAAEVADKEDGLPAAQVENLVVVETTGFVSSNPLHCYTHPKLRLSLEHLHHMTVAEILSVAQDRSYFVRGWRKQLHGAPNTKAKIVELFLEAQSSDESLHDEPSSAD